MTVGVREVRLPFTLDLYSNPAKNKMENLYFFQFDCSSDNDSFFVGSFLYRGKKFRIGPWEPDGLRVEVIEQLPSRCILTLIELEAEKSDAWKSARKYLPENPEEILEAFYSYLERVIQECRATADPRQSALSDLNKALQSSDLEIRTAGTLRSATWTDPLLESLPVIGPNIVKDGPVLHKVAAREREVQVIPEKVQVLPRGTNVKLDQQRAKALLRCLIVLDAIIRGMDHSDADFRNFRQKAPLRRRLKKHEAELPELARFVCRDEANSGLTLNCDSILSEIAVLWSASRPGIDAEHAYQLICTYFPRALSINQNDKMSKIFSEIRDEPSLAAVCD